MQLRKENIKQSSTGAVKKGSFFTRNKRLSSEEGKYLYKQQKESIPVKKYLAGFFYSMPVQLFLLHFRRYHILLIFWYILFATISGHFLQPYGANSLYLAPEYLGKVDAFSTAFVGFTVAVFIMSWNITTFILHTKHIRFLATTAQPFLKYCINNAVIPVIFLGCYLYYAIHYQSSQELTSTFDIFILAAGFSCGFAVAMFISFIYFFRADKRIYRRMATDIDSANKQYEKNIRRKFLRREKSEVRIDWFLSATLGLRKSRNVKHYSDQFLVTIFKRHHFAAVFAIFLAFVLLLIIGIFSDDRVFQVPAAASITVFFAILIAAAGAFSLFLGNWSIPAIIVLYLIVNWMYQHNIIDPRNKAYGLNYSAQRPAYERNRILKLATPANINTDKNNYLQILNRWKKKQGQEKPALFIIDVSGGGTRSATFTMNVLQRLDSITNGEIMKHTILINGASGGMIGAAYFRELYRQRINGSKINLQDKKYADNISKDILNPLFLSLVSRDLIGPVKKTIINGYTYTKDRGYAFEERLNSNTKNVLDKKLGDYKMPEANADIPSMLFNSVITRDGRKVVISTQPLRFLMQSSAQENNSLRSEPDAIDYISYFENQNPLNLRLLSALRMNATFPYVLPNVWLPTEPVIDVMDAGLRDNFGQETSLRFIDVFKDWLAENTSRVVLLQIRDRNPENWERAYENNNALSFLTKPFLLLQNNWYRLQNYYQNDQLNYMFDAYGAQFHRVCFQYVPKKTDAAASLSFHLTASEKVDIAGALNSENNMSAFKKITELIK